MRERLRNLLALLRRHRGKALVLAVLLSALGAGGYYGLRYLEVERHRRAAEEASARYDFEEAQEHLAVCLRLRPRSAALHLQMARAARRAGDYDRAAAHLTKCQQLEGTTHENALEWAMLKAQWGEVGKVEAVLQAEVERGSPQAPLVLEALAEGYVYTYRLDGATHCVEELLRREPDNVQALLLRARLSQTAGNDPRAEADYRRALKAQPEHVTARVRLGELLLRRNRPAEALAQYEYLRQGPGANRADVLLGLARGLREVGKVDASRQALDELVTRYPHDGHGLVERGKLALETESPTAAEAWLRRALADYPFDAQANFLLARSLRGQGRDAEAQRYDDAHKRIEDDLKRLEAAFKRVSQAPHDPEPRLEAGRICLRNGQEKEGERWLLSALEHDPDHGPTRAALADYYERSGKPDLAAAYRR